MLLILLYLIVEFQKNSSEQRKWSLFHKTFSGGGKWSLIDIADHTQLGSSSRMNNDSVF